MTDAPRPPFFLIHYRGNAYDDQRVVTLASRREKTQNPMKSESEGQMISNMHVANNAGAAESPLKLSVANHDM